MVEFPSTIALLYATARRNTGYAHVALTTASSESSSGDYIAPQEIYITQEDITKLYRWLKEGLEDGD